MRCSSHPNLIVRVVSRRIHNKEREREQALEEQAAYRAETPDWEGSQEDAEFTQVIDGLQKEIDVLEERRQREMTDFYMTPVGQEALRQAIEKADKEDQARKFDLEAESLAAEKRKERQKKLGNYMHNPAASASAKIWRARNEVHRVNKELAVLDDRAKHLADQMSLIDSQIVQAKEDEDEEAVHELMKEKAAVYAEYSFVEKQRKHMRAHLATTEAWLKKSKESFVGKVFDNIDKMALGYIDIMFDDPRSRKLFSGAGGRH